MDKGIMDMTAPGKIVVRESGIHGTGVYAEQAMAAGEFIIEYLGEKIPSEEGTRRSNASPQHHYIFMLDDQYDVDGNVAGNASRYINHSCDANAEAEIDGDRIMIYARRDIAAGEEITFDYAFPQEEELVACQCRASTCRGVINAIESGGPVTQAQPAGAVSSESDDTSHAA